MPSQPRSTRIRQALEWMPLQIVPAANERGYDTAMEIPAPNRATGGYIYTMHGHTPKPTPTDGYHVTATIELDADWGATVTRLVIEPSLIIREGDSHRPRRPTELRQSPVTTSALGLVKFTEIYSRIDEIEKNYAKASAEFRAAREAAEERLRHLRKRRPRTQHDAEYARHAEQALDSMSQGHRYQTRLRDLYVQDWSLSGDGIKKRISRLRKSGWLHRDYSKPGPTLIEWREEHGHDHWQKENS